MNVNPSEAASIENRDRSFRPTRIVGVYESKALSLDSTFAVPRLVSQLLGHFAGIHPSTEYVAISAKDGGIPQVDSTVPSLGLWTRLRCRMMHGAIAKKLRIPRGVELSVPYQRAKSGLQDLASTADDRTIVICVTFISTILARKILPKAKIVYWIHSLPRMGQEDTVLDAVNSADLVVTSSRAIYRDLFALICRNMFAPPVWVIPNCIDDEQFKSVTEARCAEVRKRLGLGESDIAVVHVGRAPEKGLKVIEMALSLTTFRSRNVVLISVGGITKGDGGLGQIARSLRQVALPRRS